VEGRDFLVTYEIINVGNAAATGIEVVDRYDATRFVTAAGFLLSHLFFHSVLTRQLLAQF
jgi:hypothetical protein